MKTIHIYVYKQNEWPLKQIYKRFLKDDFVWHFVYWENGKPTNKDYILGKNIILRVSDEKVKNIKEYLKENHILFKVYSFPLTRGRLNLGLLKGDWEHKHLDVSIALNHACSLAAMNLNEKDWKKFLNQINHIACNTKGFSFEQQGFIYLSMAYGSFEVSHNQIRLGRKIK